MFSQKTQERLEVKSLPGLFSVHLENHYKLPPMAAKTLCNDAVLWRELLEPRSRADGQIVYHAVIPGQPASKPVKDCEKVTVRLTILDTQDIHCRQKEGLRALEVSVMERICREAVEQGGVLSAEDVAHILRLSESSVRRYKRTLLAQGRRIIMRGDVQDMGPASCHRKPILSLYLQGYSESDIAIRTHHALESVEAYISDFLRVAVMRKDGYEPGMISRLAKLSRGKVRALLALYDEFDSDAYYSSALAAIVNIYELRRAFEKKGAMS